MFVSSKTRCRAEFLYIERPTLMTDKIEQIRRCTKLYSEPRFQWGSLEFRIRGLFRVGPLTALILS